MRPVDAKALPIIAFALTGRIVLLGFILCVGRESDVPLVNLIGDYLISCSPHKTVFIVRTGRTAYETSFLKATKKCVCVSLS